MCNFVCKVTHARKRNPWADRDELLHRCRGPRRNHLCQFLWLPRIRGLSVVGDQILGFSIDLHRRPYNTLALPCECVITPMPAFTSWAFTRWRLPRLRWRTSTCSLLILIFYPERMKGWVGLVGWPETETVAHSVIRTTREVVFFEQV